jgi:imidazolonepropionase-like amidohydrolase
MRWIVAVPVVLAAWILLGAQATGQGSTPAAGRLALVGGTIYVDPASAPIHDGVVLIEDGKIASVGTRTSIRIPTGVQVIDCAGLTVTAGFWNSHVHFLQRKWTDADKLPAPELTRQLQTMLTRYGFTSVFDTWSAWENTRIIRDRIERGEAMGPRIRSTGEAIFGQGVSVAAASWAALGFMDQDKFQTARVSNAPESLEASRKMLDRGVDALKFYAATPGRSGATVPDAAIEAGVKEAHSRGKLVFSHPSSVEGLLASVRGGVDVVAHTTPQSGPWDAATIASMKQAGVALIPTLKLWTYEFRHERGSLADGFVSTAVGQLKAWVGVGGVVLFGTDVGYMSDYDTAEEFALMSQAGMSLGQILASLTTAPAERFGDSKRLGRIAAGFDADLTVLGRDPSHDIRALGAVAYTIRNGNIIYRDR